jgi:hypothetical protein
MEKKNPYRFTIAFNRHDPTHVRTAQLLNDLDRGAAAYIAKAVTFYRQNNLPPDFSQDQQANLRILLEEIIESREKKRNASSALPAPGACPPVEPAPACTGAAMPDETEDFSDSELADIASALQAFRQ